MKAILISIIFMVYASNANAFYVCSGNVTGLTIKPGSGQVLVEKLGDLKWPVLCSVKVEQNGVAPESCKAIYSLLLAAQASSKPVKLWFNDEASGGDCSSHTAWGFLSGWYLGPQLQN